MENDDFDEDLEKWELERNWLLAKVECLEQKLAFVQAQWDATIENLGATSVELEDVRRQLVGKKTVEFSDADLTRLIDFINVAANTYIKKEDMDVLVPKFREYIKQLKK